MQKLHHLTLRLHWYVLGQCLVEISIFLSSPKNFTVTTVPIGIDKNNGASVQTKKKPILDCFILIKILFLFLKVFDFLAFELFVLLLSPK